MTVKYKDYGLKKLSRLLKQRLPTVKVGILGADPRAVTETGPGLTNAEIGAKHEFGIEGMPMRSFLRMPITQGMARQIERSGGFGPDAIKELIKTGDLTEWMTKIGIVAEACVQEAFDTGADGQWTPSNMAHKKNHQTLVETQQLRNSITSEVVP